MNEQERANALAKQLDTLLAGDSLPETPEGELAGLLQIADQLTEATPAPRPDFGPALKESLLKSVVEGGPATTGGTTMVGLILTMVVGGIVVVLIGLGLVVGSLLQTPATPTPENDLAPAEAPDENAPVNVIPSPSPTAAAATPQVTSTNQATDTLTLPSPSPSPTAIIDVLPPVTITLEATGEFVSPPDLIPGQPSSSNDDDENSGGSSGDHNRGHGNDSDGHDEDNPGNSRRDGDD